LKPSKTLKQVSKVGANSELTSKMWKMDLNLKLLKINNGGNMIKKQKTKNA
jgi:hypothetical protein